MLDVAFATTSNASLVVKFLAVSFLNNFSMKSQWRFACQDIYWKPSSKPAKRKKANRGKARPIWYNKKYQEWEDDEEEDDPYIPAVKMTGASGTTGTAEVPETGPTPAEAIGPGCPLN